MRGRHEIILADPPWMYSDKQSHRPDNYRRMRPREIRALPVQRLAAESACLFLWTTAPQMPIALSVIDAWGFKYKTVAFTWIKMNKKGNKPTMGMGWWTRANAEFCLLGTRGKPRRVSAAVSSVIIAPRPKLHSEKPSQTRERIVELLGDRPRIELFARQRVSGWDAWGDELPPDKGIT